MHSAGAEEDFWGAVFAGETVERLPGGGLPEFPVLHADVRATKLMIEGTTLMPARAAAITNGD